MTGRNLARSKACYLPYDIMESSNLEEQSASDTTASHSATMPRTPTESESEPNTPQQSFDDSINAYFDPINRAKRLVNALTELHTVNQGKEVKHKLYALGTLKLPRKNPSMQAIEGRLEVYSELLALHQQQHRALEKLKARMEELLLDVARQMGRVQERRELKIDTNGILPDRYEYVLEAILESIEDGEVHYLKGVMEVVKELGEKKAEETQKMVDELGVAGEVGEKKTGETQKMIDEVEGEGGVPAAKERLDVMKGSGSKNDPMDLS
ncbi:hypothetical protein BDV96DRAFT_606408 [Lophiotrema nucula]|uniref:Uncharacterized protein n=1 Tax=Lophiotrema nucula TaxID=690887 RepID=A0A6A5YKG5_9PLEO|nr:hypothetical protein BDV96DRAFT_606408 [Lophiotrema nucula]